MRAARTARTRRVRAPITREMVVRLEDLPNVGPSIAGDLRGIGVMHPAELVGRDPYQLFDTLCAATGIRHDPCVLDVFLSAVRFMEGAPAHKWWHYTAERKLTLQQKPGQRDPVGRAATVAR